MVSCPLLTPLTFLCADTSEMCSETGLRGLGSVRRFAFGRLLCPEFTLRKPPRITVRGHPVQDGGETLRKAPLQSSVDPWSTRRHCGPLAFRRATEGSRVQRKGWGVKRGRETLVSLPLLTPQPFLRTRLPPVARLKARGPQGRLVLQGITLDRSGAGRSTNQAPCTVWPCTDSAANHAK